MIFSLSSLAIPFLFASSSAPPVMVPDGVGIVGVGSAKAAGDVLDHWVFAEAIPEWISWLMMFSAGAAVLMIIAGGAMVMVGGAEEEWRTRGMQTVVFAIAGMIIATLSYTSVEVLNHISLDGQNPETVLLNGVNGNIDGELIEGRLQDELLPGIIQIALKLVATLTTVLLIYGGALMVLRNDDDEKVENAKKIILWGVIGLVIIAVAYAIVEGVTNFDFSKSAP